MEPTLIMRFWFGKASGRIKNNVTDVTTSILLLAHEADPNARNMYSCAPLHFAENVDIDELFLVLFDKFE
jgi:hypothetical protein